MLMLLGPSDTQLNVLTALTELFGSDAEVDHLVGVAVLDPGLSPDMVRSTVSKPVKARVTKVVVKPSLLAPMMVDIALELKGEIEQLADDFGPAAVEKLESFELKIADVMIWKIPSDEQIRDLSDAIVGEDMVLDKLVIVDGADNIVSYDLDSADPDDTDDDDD